MFNKVQQGKDTLNAIRKAKQLQKVLREVEHSEADGDVRVKVNGLREVVYLEINGEDRSDIAELINKAQKNVEKKNIEKFREMGMDLSDMLGGMG